MNSYFDGNIANISKKDGEFGMLRAYIEKNCGIVLSSGKSYLIETRLSKILADTKLDSFDELYAYIIKNKDLELTEKIINAITTNETFWFRDNAPWAVLEERILPQLVEKMRTGQKHRARIWCAAVSTGQEAYSTAMCIDNYLKKHHIQDISPANFEIVATDISTQVLKIAKKGRYDSISIMRGLNEFYRTNYFKKNGAAWDIDPDLKARIKFAKFNLQEDFNEMGMFDIIFCRYVLIYFSPALKEGIIKRLHAALNDEGTLFTGNYVIYGMFEEQFENRYYKNLTYFEKKAVNAE